MRPRLREDVRCMPCPGGVYLHSDRGVCTLEGATLHAWLTRLQSFMTGEHTLDELTEALPAAQRGMVDRLVRTLYEQGFVLDVRADRSHSLTVTERQTYAEEIGFVRYSLDSAEYRFQRYRQARVTLLGSGPVLTALLDAGLRSGLRSMRVAGCGPEEVVPLRQAVQRARRDGDQHVEIDPTALVTDKAVAAGEFGILEEVEAIVGQVAGEVTVEFLDVLDKRLQVVGTDLIEGHGDDARLAFQKLQTCDGAIEVAADAADLVVVVADGIQ